MASRIAALEQLIHELTKLPGIGEKTAQRLSYYILRAKGDYSQKLEKALEDVRNKVHACPQCFAYTDHEELCSLCEDLHREDSKICVVEEASDVFRIESSGAFRGRYHVLQGAISPLEGIQPDDLKIQELINRVDRGQSGEGPAITEAILALDADLEGDTTALYISKILTSKGVKITRIAHGVPFGADIDYIDRKTLGRAIENRVEL